MAKEKTYTIDGHDANLWNDVGDESLLEDDNESALTAYLQAARLGHVEAMNSVANCYSEKDDDDNMLLWSRRAAAFGQVEAIDWLGEVYDPAWHDEFVDAIRTNGFFGEIDSSASAVETATPTVAHVEAVAAPAPLTNVTTDPVTYTAPTAEADHLTSFLAGMTVGGFEGITS